MAYSKEKRDEFFAKYKDPRWQKVRLRILERDKWTCQLCGATDQTLHVHHAAYDPFRSNPWETAEEVMFTACEDCHDAEHESAKFSRYLLAVVMGQLGVRSSVDYDVLSDLLVEAIRQGPVLDQAQRIQNLATALSRFESVKESRLGAGTFYVRDKRR